VLKYLIPAAILAVGFSANAQSPDPLASDGYSTVDEPVVADTDAGTHVGEVITVQGLVASVFVSAKGNEFVNFEQPYPDQVFSAVIFSYSAGQFGDIAMYQGKQVQVTGRVTLYKGKPEIIVRSPDQLHIVQ
jgi:DNA/RNA endonuclease YhcR with UshA esterase domain